MAYHLTYSEEFKLSMSDIKVLKSYSSDLISQDLPIIWEWRQVALEILIHSQVDVPPASGLAADTISYFSV